MGSCLEFWNFKKRFESGEFRGDLGASGIARSVASTDEIRISGIKAKTRAHPLTWFFQICKLDPEINTIDILII